MLIYEKKIKKWASSMPHNSNKLLADPDDEGFLGIVVKNSLDKINSLRNTQIMTLLVYDNALDMLLLHISPIDKPMGSGIIVPIKLGRKRVDNILINLANYKGYVDVYCSSNDLEVVWSTRILREPYTRIELSHELKKAKLI